MFGVWDKRIQGWVKRSWFETKVLSWKNKLNKGLGEETETSMSEGMSFRQFETHVEVRTKFEGSEKKLEFETNISFFEQAYEDGDDN